MTIGVFFIIFGFSVLISTVCAVIVGSIKLVNERDIYKEALEKIADPRKRDHREPDAYTELGCVMNIADQALQKAEE